MRDRALIVEDNDDMRDLLQEALKTPATKPSSRPTAARRSRTLRKRVNYSI
jgi:DNA-binding response OmpR family regulator